MLSSMSIKMSDMIDNLVVEVDQEFIDYRNNQVKNGNYSRRNNFKNSDYLLLERNLIKRKLIDEPIPYKNESYAWRYDGGLDSSKNDFKHLTLYKGKYFFNVYDEKNEYGMSMKDRLNQSIEFDQLDNFVFYTSNPIMKRKYVVGDKIKFSFLKVLKAKDVMSSLSYNESNNNFYKII